jgi:hypothetical protein
MIAGHPAADRTPQQDKPHQQRHRGMRADHYGPGSRPWQGHYVFPAISPAGRPMEIEAVQSAKPHFAHRWGATVTLVMPFQAPKSRAAQ